MQCPACRQPMVSRSCEAHYGRTLPLDLCRPCGVLWLDSTESEALTPGATLDLFAIIGADSGAVHAPFPERLPCPRCGRCLAHTVDRQHNTQFSYWRCPADDGRLVSFLDFLREKDFIRPLSAKELAALRGKIRSVTCASCGAPVDLAADSICAHCRAPLSILDPDQVDKVVRALRDAETRRRTPDPTLPLRLALDRLHVDSLCSRLGCDDSAAGSTSTPGSLLGAGLAALTGILSGNR